MAAIIQSKHIIFILGRINSEIDPHWLIHIIAAMEYVEIEDNLNTDTLIVIHIGVDHTNEICMTAQFMSALCVMLHIGR